MTSPSRSVPRSAIEELLRSLDEFVIVRNEDVFANLARGGDVDLLAADPAAAEHAIAHHLGNPVVVQRRSYVTGYYYPWGYIDVFPTMEWRGAAYIPASRVLGQKTFTRSGFPRARLAHEALVCWFSSLLWGAFFKERYRELIRRAATEDAAEFRTICEHAAGRRWGARLFAMATDGRPDYAVRFVRELRRAVWLAAFRRAPVRTLRGYVSFWRHELKLRLRPPLPWVAILGPDGSGKSSVIDELAQRFTPPLCAGVTVCHWRPGVIWKPAGDGSPETDPHGKAARSLPASALKLAMLFADWTAGYWGRLVHLRAKGALLVSDRPFIDLLADPRRYRYGAPRWLARVVAGILPSPDLVIVLDAPVEVLRTRKQEIAEHDLSLLRDRYRGLVSGRRNAYVVDASRALDEVVAELEVIILEAQARRTGVSVSPPAARTPGVEHARRVEPPAVVPHA